jgi:alkylation response protein AidB-like acyl-CoA dehydrogenase
MREDEDAKMDMRLSPAQMRLRDTVAQLFALPAAVIQPDERAPDDSPDGSRRSAAIWRALVEHDMVRLTLPEHAGGMGLGLSESIIVLEELGKRLLESPYLDTLTAADLIAQAGQQHEHWPLLAAIGRGSCMIALALGAYGLNNTPLNADALLAAEPTDAGWSLSGRIDFVAFAGRVDYFAVAACATDGPMLVLIPRARHGISIRRHAEIGRGEFASVTFERTPITVRDALGSGQGWVASFMPILATAHVRHAAYLIGMAQRALDLTLDYTKERKQFGQRIASFQSIAFRLAAQATRLEAIRLLAQQTAWQHDHQIDIRRRAAGLLAQVSDLVRDITTEAIQMHGAFGVTEAAEIQRFYRCAARDALLFGGPQQLRAAAAALLAEE